MCQPLDHTRHGILGTTVLRCHLIADIHYVLPILGGEILVGRLGYMARKLVLIPHATIQSSSSSRPKPSMVNGELTDDIVEGVLLGAKHFCALLYYLGLKDMRLGRV
jgi:hypothetical protein